MNEQEKTLLANLDELEKSQIRKGGDALQNAPHDGGFATQGTNIQEKAKAAKVKKALAAMMKGGMSEDEANETLKLVTKGFGDDASGDESDDSSSDDGDEGAGDDAGSDDEGEAPAPPMKKSLGASKLANASRSTKKKEEETSIRKSLSDDENDVVDAVPVLKSLVEAVEKLTSTPVKDDGLRKSFDGYTKTQREFNGKLAKALTVIAGMVIKSNATIDKIAGQPVPNSRDITLRKGDVREPAFNDGNINQLSGEPQTRSPLWDVEPMKIQERLVEMAMKSEGRIDIMEVTKFENSKCNVDKLFLENRPLHDALVKSLCPAS